MVPEGWCLKCLEELAFVERGKFSARPRNDPKYYGGNVPFVQTGNVSSAGTYLTEYTQTLNEEGVKVSKIFPPNSILITIAANIGDTSIATFDVACPDSVVAIQARPNKAHFFWLKLALDMQKSELDRNATQNAQKNINLQVLRPLLFRTPPLEEQTKIAQILSTWNKAIETTEKLIENSKAQKKVLMQQLLTGKRRFPKFDEKWNEVQLSSIANITMGSSPRSDAYNTNGAGLPLIQGNADISNRFSRPRTYTSQITKECNVNDILFSVRAPVGLVSISKHHACIGRGIAAINAKVSSTIRFIYQLLLSREAMWKKLSQGSTFDAVNSVDIKKLPICVPSDRDEQFRIAKVLDHQDNLTGNLLNQLGILRRQKKALMQQLLTGKRRVKLANNERPTL
ncbi:MAG: restriction endonuclease subunit S [Candidatus Thiodiazotropha sp. (ex Rostrolucina anterorostrata)]|nr:restriction endonuclease subunit S [Candidatus Thiodiazotropha sp. (ex Rostrolucina anterorostrata)]